MTGLVRVWIVPVDLAPQAATKCRRVLDEGERARAAEFVSPRDEQRFVIGHGALRILVGRELGIPPAALAWAPGAHGKPALAPPWSALHTSLSHSADLIAVAVTASLPVGIDIQRLVPGLDTVALSARFFRPPEARYVAAGRDAGSRADRFARLWARKEAVVKAAGGRLWPNLRIAVQRRDVVRCADPAGPCRVADVAAPPGFRAAVALAGAAPFAVQTANWASADAAPAGVA